MGAGASLSAQQKAEMKMIIDRGKGLAQKYSKESYRAAKAGIKEGRRIVRHGIEVARALSRQVDLTNSRRLKAIAAAKEERRAAMIKGKYISDSGSGGKDATAFEEPIQPMIIEEEDGGELEQQPIVGIFEDEQDGTSKKVGVSNSREEMEKANQQRIADGQALRIRKAKQVSQEHIAKDAVRFVPDLVADKSKAHSAATMGLAVTNFKKGLETRRLEKRANLFGTDAMESVQQEEDHAAGWNRKHPRPIGWVAVNLYIIRGPGECKREVDIIYTEVMPKLRSKVAEAGIEINLRDLDPEAATAGGAVSAALDAVSNANAIRIVLLGEEYGEAPGGTIELPEPLRNDPDLQGDLSLLDTLATVAAKCSVLLDSNNPQVLPMPNTLVISCVDPKDRRSAEDAGPDAGPAAAGRRRQSLVAGVGPAPRRQSLISDPVSESTRPPAAAPERFNPLAILRRKNAEAQRKQREDLERLSAVVLKALCQDPRTGKARAPHQIFMDLDVDGGGTVDRDEFAAGTREAGLVLTREEVDLLWGSLDEDGSGELSFEEIAQKFQAQYEVALRAELREAQFMPARLSLKLERFLPRAAFRARRSGAGEPGESHTLREAAWGRQFATALLDDLERLAPWVATARQDRDPAARARAARDRAQPLCFHPDVPEYFCHADLVQRLGKRTYGRGVSLADSPMAFQRDLVRQQLMDYANGTSSWPAALVGGEASGRTSMMGDVINAIRKERPADHVIFISVGSAPDSAELPLVLLQICSELVKRFGTPGEIDGYQVSNIEEEFPKLLMKVVVDCFVLVILDGCDLIRKGSSIDNIDWFPATIPAKMRLILTMDEGNFLNKLRKIRSRYSGPTELVEIFLHSDERAESDGMNSSIDADSRSRSRASSAQSSATSKSNGASSKKEFFLLRRMLASSLLFADAGAAVTEEILDSQAHDSPSGLEALVSQIVDYAMQETGRVIVERCLILLLISRNGIIEQDLYELLNANTPDLNLKFCRISWQGFICLQTSLKPLLQLLTFGAHCIVDIEHRCVKNALSKLLGTRHTYEEYHGLLSMHYISKLEFLQTPFGCWFGNHHRAITELCFHIFKASLWSELKEVLSDLRYIEARCSLGLHQAWSLLLDYTMICTDEQANFAWIKTDLLVIKDCYAMVKRYAYTICMNPKWLFSLAANLPDATGPARLAKRDWTSKRESRPQLAWLNKSAGQSPCEIRISEPQMVMHSTKLTQDMTRLVIVGQDKNVYVWKLQDSTLLCELAGHEDHVMYCDISLDDRYILTCSRDGSLALWSMPLIPPEDSFIRSTQEQDVQLDATPKILADKLIVSIPAHMNTVWTCSISTTFLCTVLLIEIDPGDGTTIQSSKCKGVFARQSEGRIRSCHVPVSFTGTVKCTRLVSEDEKRKIRLNHSIQSGYDSSHAKRAARSRQRSDPSASEFVIDDYVDQRMLKGKIAVFDTESEEDESILWGVARDLENAGTMAIIFVCADQDIPYSLHRRGTNMSIKIPVMSVGRSSKDILQDGKSFLIQRELSTGTLMASGSSDCTIKIWDMRQVIQGRSPAVKPKATLVHHEAYISHVSFSHYGDMLTSSSGDFAVIIWSMKDFSPIFLYSECLAPSLCSVWSPDDSLIGTACHDGYVRIWRVEDGKTMKATQGPHAGHLWVCAFARDENHFATAGHDGLVVLWNIDQMLKNNKEVMVFQGHAGPISSLNFSADSRKIVTSSGDRTVRIWRTDRDLEDYTLLYASSLIEARKQEQKSKNDLKDILMSAGKEMWVYSGAAKVFWEETAHELSVTCICFSPNCCELVTGGADMRVVVWSIKAEAPKPTIIRVLHGHDAAISALCYSPDGSKIASGCVNGNICVWASTTGRRMFEFKEHVERIWSISIHPLSTRMISSSSDMTVRLWRLDDPFAGSSKEPGLTLYSDSDDDNVDGHGDEISTKPSRDASAPRLDLKATVNVIDLQSSLVLQTIICPRIIYSCCFALNRKWMATASADSKICIYEFADAEMSRLEEFKLIPPAGSRPEGMHKSYIRKILFDHSSRQVISCGVDTTLKLWSTRNSLLLRSFRGHEKEVWSCCISPDAKALVSCSLDGSCRIWNLESGEELFQVKHQDTIFACEFSPDGRFLATGSYDGVVKLWEKDKIDFQKKQGRGWPRVRDLLPKIARMKENPCAISTDGQISCYVKSNELDTFLSKEALKQKKALKQKITVEYTVTGNLIYSFTLQDIAGAAAIGPDEGETIIFSHGLVLRVYVHGKVSFETNSGHKAAILDLRFNNQGTRLASCSDDATVLLWKLGGGKLTRVKKLKGHTGSVLCSCFSAGGDFMATAGHDQCIKFWDCSGWGNVGTLIQAHTSNITTCGFDRTCSKLLSAGEDRTLRVWNFSKHGLKSALPRESVRIKGLSSTPICAGFTCDGLRIVAVLSGRKVCVWHAQKGSPVCQWEFCPFDGEAFSNTVWKSGFVALTENLNAAIVSDSAGNTCAFALLAICSPKSDNENL